MSYFEHTARDVEEAGEKAKRDMARLIAAVLLDADTKMDDPETYDRTYVMEDMLGRLVAAIGPYTKEPFEVWRNHRLAYPEMMARDESGLVRPFVSHHATNTETPIGRDTERAIVAVLRNRERERAALADAVQHVAALQTWGGLERHAYDASYSGMVCAAMVLRDGYGTGCGLPASHEVHNMRSEE